MHVFYTPDIQERAELPEEEAAHAIRVLRLQTGDEIMLTDGKGNFYRAGITATGGKRCLVNILEVQPQEPLWKGHLHIAMAPTKNMDRTEWFAEKATEIGLDELTFLNCRHSERKVIKTERINKILVSAIKQSLKARLPKLNDMTDFDSFIRQSFPGQKFIAHCYPGEKPLLKDIVQPGEDALVLIGPEGDFSEEEVAGAEACGFTSISLGRSRLRTETAALVACHTNNFPPAMPRYDLITILGPTASGKTSLAAALARRLDAEIISADSRQVYRGMDIGTGKDLADYAIDGQTVPYHLIDIAEPGYKYNVFEYQRDFLSAYEGIRQRGRLPILCGGTGLYLESVLKGYRLLPVPENAQLRASLSGKTLEELAELLRSYKTLHNTTDIDTPKRAIRAIEIEEYYRNRPVDERPFPRLESLIIGVAIDRDLRREKITRRLRQRLDEGMADEVRRLLAKGLTPDDLIYYGLEYKYVTLYVTGQLAYDDMFTRLETAIHQFAKRQMTWFRGMERRGFVIHWVDASLPMEEKIAFIRQKLQEN